MKMIKISLHALNCRREKGCDRPGARKCSADLQWQLFRRNQGTESDYSFQRSISVPDGVARDKVKASYENGILTVIMPKEGYL